MKSFRRLISYLKPYWLPALLAPLLMALEVSMDLTQPRLLQSIVDVGIAHKNQAFVLHTGLHMIGVALIGLIGGAGCTVFATIASMNFGASVRADVFRKVQQFSFGNLDRLEAGGLITRLTNDVDQVQMASEMFMRVLVRAPMLCIGSLVMAIVTSAKLSLLLLGIGPLVIGLLIVVNRNAHPLFTAVQKRLDRLNTIVQENLAGVRVVKAFGRSDHECGRFEDANDQLCRQTVKASSLVAMVMPVMILLLNMGVVGVIWFGGVSVNRGQLQLGQLMAFINYLLQMLSSLMMAGMMLMQVVRADASAERIIEVMDSKPEIQDLPDALKTPELSGMLAFDKVDFSYGGTSGTPVLHDISFTAEPGQFVAILGATGSGKSTLINLVPRLYDVTGGCILIHGTDVRAMDQEALRRQITVVMQETVLFSGTIKDNLRFGRPEASDAEIEEAATIAHAHDFIMSFTDGYDTELGQRGVNLSGGQKQRLSIARALVTRPSILIMDDCLSAVDMATEAGILSALKIWPHRCTRIVIAQRINAVMEADKILVMEDGSIAAIGTHSELLKASQIYQGIVNSQLDKQEASSVR